MNNVYFKKLLQSLVRMCLSSSILTKLNFYLSFIFKSSSTRPKIKGLTTEILWPWLFICRMRSVFLSQRSLCCMLNGGVGTKQQHPCWITGGDKICVNLRGALRIFKVIFFIIMMQFFLTIAPPHFSRACERNPETSFIILICCSYIWNLGIYRYNIVNYVKWNVLTVGFRHDIIQMWSRSVNGCINVFYMV